MKQYTVAILGATGAVGTQMIECLAEQDFPVGELRLLASARSAGKKVETPFGEVTIAEAGPDAFAGCDIVRQGEQIKRHIGYMSQRFSLYDDLTVRENIRLFGGIYGLSRRETGMRSDDLLHRLDFVSEGNTPVGALPLGWKQKLAFAIATLHQPEVVFLDEPTGGVDPLTRRQFWEMIYEAAAGGTTLFVTTHYMDEAEYCSRVSIMVDGRIRALDTPARLKQQFAARSMDEVFRLLARGAQRSE